MLNRTCVYIVIGLCLYYLRKKLDFACILNQEEMRHYATNATKTPFQNTDPWGKSNEGKHLAKRDMTTFVTIPHRIHVWYIYLHLVDFYGKCRYIYHTWILMGTIVPLLHLLTFAPSLMDAVWTIPQTDDRIGTWRWFNKLSQTWRWRLYICVSDGLFFMLAWKVNVYLFSWSWHFQFFCWFRW